MVDENNEKSPLGRLEKVLYSKKNGSMMEVRKLKLRPKEYDVSEKWKDQPEIPYQKDIQEEEMPFFKKILTASILFFVLSVVVALFVFYGGINIVSSRNVDIVVAGPVSIGGGEVFSLQVAVQNNNTTPIKMVNLVVEYPEGTYSAEDKSKALNRVTLPLNDIPARGTTTNEMKAVLFGEEGKTKEIIMTVEYETPGSNAVFSKEKKYEITVGSSPVGINISSLKEVISGQETTIVVEVVSNSNNRIEGLLVSSDYPFGFEFKEATPSPAYGNNVWNLGDLNPGEKRTITIKGIISGQNEEERVFRFSSGLQSGEDEKSMDTILSSSAESFFIKKPFIALDLFLNGETSSEYFSEAGKSIKGEIFWSNNLPDKIIDAEITVALNGISLDKSSVSASQGFYQSSNSTIVWNKSGDEDLAEITPGKKGKVSFAFSSYGLSRIMSSGFKNQEIVVDIGVKGKRISEKNVSEDIKLNISRKVRISSDLMLTSRAVYFIGPFQNSGPVPPKVDQNTTFTVIWTVANTSNDVTDATVTAILPSYVSWAGVISPSDEDIIFNPVNNEVVWEMGDVPAGVGVKKSPREVAFQISFLPSLSQVESSPNIVEKIVVAGKDSFTGIDLKNSVNPITIGLSTDPKFTTDYGRVVK